MAAGFNNMGKNDKKNSAPGTPPPSAKKPVVRLQSQSVGVKGARQRVFVGSGGSEEVEVTGTITAALAHALWQLRGGTDIANWVDAEGLLDEMLATGGVIPRGATPAAPEVVLPGKRTTARR